MAGSPDGLVRAAGGVVWRAVAGGAVEILLVHRPKYDDWSLPKGKLDEGEDDLAAALREVEEETGLRCRAGAELPSTHYRDALGRPKVVRYWLMEPEVGDFQPSREVDEVCWVTPASAAALLTYDHDRELVGDVSERLAG